MDIQTIQAFGPYIGIFASLIGLFYVYFKEILGLKSEINEHKVETLKEINKVKEELTEEIHQVSEREKGLETESELLGKVIENQIAQSLKRPTHFRLDELIDQLKDGSISRFGLLELRDIISSEIDETVKIKDTGRTLAYSLLLVRVNKRIGNISHKD